MKLTCPACSRPNAPQLKRCLYCGADLPTPASAEPPKARELNPDLDQLLTAAIQSGDVSQAANLLGPQPDAAPPPTAEVTPLSDMNVEPLGAAYTLAPEFIELEPMDPTDLPESPLSDPALLDFVDLPVAGIVAAEDPTDLPPMGAQALPYAGTARISHSPNSAGSSGYPIEPERSTDLVTRLLDEARADLLNASAAWSRGDLQASEALISQAMEQLQSARARVRPGPAPAPTLKLPNFRSPYALVIDGSGDGERSALLAEALGVDMVTARLQALSRYPRLALQGESRNSLEALASRVRSTAGLRASVVPQGDVFDVPAPLTLRRVEGAHWRLSAGELWNEPDVSEPDILMAPPNFNFACLGEIVIRRFRRVTPRRGRGESTWSLSGERRLAVLDLHSPDRLLRIVEGITSFEGLPGYEPSSTPASLQHLIEALPSLYPGLQVSGRRVCLPRQNLPHPKAEKPELVGWDTWEEHTRLCRLHDARRPR